MYILITALTVAHSTLLLLDTAIPWFELTHLRVSDLNLPVSDLNLTVSELNLPLSDLLLETSYLVFVSLFTKFSWTY